MTRCESELHYVNPSNSSQIPLREMIHHSFSFRESDMSWQGSFDLNDSTSSDWAMMEEVLDLLVSESTSSGQERNSSGTSNNNKDRREGDVMLHGSVTTCNEAVRESKENKLLGRDEEKYSTQQEQEPLAQARPILNSMPSTPLQPADTASKRPLLPPMTNRLSLCAQQLVHGAAPQSFAADAYFLDFAAASEPRQSLPAPVEEPLMARETITSASISISPPASILHQSLRDSQLPSKSPCTPNLDSNVLPTGQRVHVINSVEFEELRRKMQMQTASRRYRKRKKEATRHKRMRVQELQVELSRLQYMEAQTNQYQQRSVESLHQELKMYQDEAADLCCKLQDAAREELDWITAIRQLRQRDTAMDAFSS